MESADLSPRTQFPLSRSLLPQSFLGDHSLPLSSLEVHILPTQARSIKWLILDGQVTPSEPLSCKELHIVGIGSSPPDLNLGRPSADPWTGSRTGTGIDGS